MDEVRTAVEAMVYEKLASGHARCHVCQRRCVIAPGKKGFCKGRVNQDGKLVSLLYGWVSYKHVAPIEIKPLYHFWPGSHALSLGSFGCNFRCKGCQNWHISRAELDTREAEFISPEASVALAKRLGCQGLSWTYNEPTIWFEYTLESAKLAKQAGLYTNYVTNGFITEEALALIGPYLDSFRVDIKGFSEAYYRDVCGVPDFHGALDLAKQAKLKHRMHVEVVTNVVPGLNDAEADMQRLASWIRDNLDADTPWHVTRFVPHLDLAHLPPTPVQTLERIVQIGEEAGLKFVYIGNVPGHPKDNTYCPSCGKPVIVRHGYRVAAYEVTDGRCRFCGEAIPIVGRGGETRFLRENGFLVVPSA